jgi:hypothetical protein
MVLSFNAIHRWWLINNDGGEWNISAVWIAWQSMMQHVYVKLNPWLSQRKWHSRRRRVLSQANFGKKLLKWYTWSTALYGAGNQTHRETDYKYLECFEMCCCRNMGISWTDRVKNGVLQRHKEERNTLHRLEQRKASWVGHTLHRNCLLKHVVEWTIYGMVRRGGRREQLLYDLKDRYGSRFRGLPPRST